MNAEMVNGLAVIGAVSCVYWVYRGGAALLRLAQDTSIRDGEAAVSARAAPAPAPAPAAPDNDIAVIAAAVYTMLGAHRLLHIEDTRGGTVWTAEGRWQQQTSHSPR